MNIPDQKVNEIEEQKKDSKGALDGFIGNVDNKLRIIIALIIAAGIFLYSAGKIDGKTVILFLAGIFIFVNLSQSPTSKTRLLQEDECKALLLEKLNYKQAYTSEIPSGKIIMNLSTVRRSYNRELVCEREISFTVDGNYTSPRDFVCTFDLRFPGEIISIVEKKFGYTGDETPNILIGYNPKKLKTTKFSDIVDDEPQTQEVLRW